VGPLQLSFAHLAQTSSYTTAYMYSRPTTARTQWTL